MNIVVGGIVQRSFRFVGNFGIDGGVDVVSDVGVNSSKCWCWCSAGNEWFAKPGRRRRGRRGCSGRRQLREKGRDR